MRRTPEPSKAISLHSVTPRTRLLAAFFLISGITLMPRTVDAVYLLPTTLLAVLWILARMPVRYALKRMLVAEFFILSIGFLSLFSPPAAASFLPAFLKSNLCVFTLVLLTWTTPFVELLTVLRQMRVPSIMVTTLALMCRYLPVLAGEVKRMERARSSRTFSTRRLPVWQNLGTILGQLFLRSTRRAERIYLAMCARGWK